MPEWTIMEFVNSWKPDFYELILCICFQLRFARTLKPHLLSDVTRDNVQHLCRRQFSTHCVSWTWREWQAAAAGVTEGEDAVTVMHAPAVVIGTVLYRPSFFVIKSHPAAFVDTAVVYLALVTASQTLRRYSGTENHDPRTTAPRPQCICLYPLKLIHIPRLPFTMSVKPKLTTFLFCFRSMILSQFSWNWPKTTPFHGELRQQRGSVDQNLSIHL